MAGKKLYNIVYLEDQDVSKDGNILNNLNAGKVGVIMLQGSFCGHCTNAKPAYQKLANRDDIFVATIQIDGSESEKRLASKISSSFGNAYQGVPHYYIVDENGKFVKHHQGGRTTADILNACNI